MKILLRLIMICLLLSGLAYGSYAFGRYVLSTKLFAGTITPNPHSVLAGTSAQRVGGSVGRTNYQGGTPRVQVNVLPADAAGSGPEPPPADVMTHELESGSGSGGGTRIASTRHATPPTSVKRGSSKSRAFDKDSGLSALGQDGTGFDANGNGNPLRNGRYNRSERYGRSDSRTDNHFNRRYRRRRSSASAASNATSTGADASTSRIANDGASSSGEGTPSRAEANDSGSSRSPAPRLNREERRPRRSETVDRPARSTRQENRESPVPRPESGSGSSSGGDSPVPQPG